MKLSIQPIMAALVLGAAAFSMAGNARAGCGAVPSMLKPNAWVSPSPAASALRPTYYRPGAEGQFLLTSEDETWHDIVGMWRFKLLAPNGAVVDVGYAQWHSDGTEIQNSGLHAPITSNFCLGVWQEIGNDTYQLNHFPLGWDATGQSPANAIQLTETVKLTDHDHMTGTFKLKVYGWSTPHSLDVSPTTPVATVTGSVTATRVSVWSTVPGSTE